MMASPAAHAGQSNGIQSVAPPQSLKDQYKAIVQRIQQLRQAGLTEATSPELHQLSAWVNEVAAAQQQVPQYQQVQQGTAPLAPADAAHSAPLVAFTDEHTAALRCQILAFKALQHNEALPAELQTAIFIPGEAQKYLAAQDQAAEAAELARRSKLEEERVAAEQQRRAAEQQRVTELLLAQAKREENIERLRVLEENEAPLAEVEDPTSLVYPYNAFNSPKSVLWKAPSTNAGMHATRLIPTLLPLGLDADMLARERNRFIQARVNQRISELENIPSNPVVNRTHSAGTSAADKIRALIELKSLHLLNRQKQLRESVVVGFNSAAALSLASDRASFRRYKKYTLKDARVTEELELKQRLERETRIKQKHTSHLEEIAKHARNLMTAHRVHQAKFLKLGKAMLKFHVEAERDEQKRVERVSKERLKALRADDEEGYLALIDTAKDTRITHLLRQTDAFLDSLAAAVVAQQTDAVHRQRPSASAAAAIAAGIDAATGLPMVDPSLALAPTVSESTFGAAPVFDEEAAVPDKVDYYNVAHRIKETITEQPTMLIGGQLKSYQIKGLEWMISLYNNNVNGILADEMGLGKTIQTIALITFLIEKKQQNGPFLVIVPLSTMPNWIMEFEKWAPAVRMISYKGSPAQRKTAQADIRQGGFQVLLTTYEYIIKDRPLLAKIKWVHMIIDEGHRMKNAQSKLSITLTTYYSSRYRLILTGTPLQNNLPELWALLNFVLPKIFGSVKSFDEWFNAPFANTGGQDKIEVNEEESLLVIRRLHKVLRPFLLRRLKKDVEKDLPDKVERVIKCRMSSLQLKLTRQIKEHGMIFTDGPVDSKSRATGIRGLQNQIMQLRKICNHPFTFPEVERTIDATGTTDATLYRVAGKFEILDRILPKLFATGHRVLMFFQMTTVMTIFEDYLNFRRIAHLRLDGTTKHEDRASLLKAFNAPDSQYPIFILSTRAGGLGLNLQTADTVIIFDSDWNPHQDLQAQDRAHRIGQKKEVRILRLVTERSVEELVMAGASRKIEMDKKVIQAGRYDNKSTAEERDEYLRALLDVADEEPEEDDELDEATMLNDAIARTEEERALFTQMDVDRKIGEARAWAASGNLGKMPERLIQEHELPQVYQMEHEKHIVVDEIFEGDRRARARTNVQYDDGMSEEQWLQALEEDEEAPDPSDKKRGKRAVTQVRKLAGEGMDSPSSSAGGRGRSRAASVKDNYGTEDDDDDSIAGDNKRKRAERSESVIDSMTPSLAGDDVSGAPKRRKTQVVFTPTQERMKVIFDKILDVLDDEDHPVHGHQRAGLFAVLPSKVDYKDYYALTAHPISLKEIKKKVLKGTYASIQDFKRDIHLMCANSMAYNAVESIVYEDAESLKNTFDEQFNALFAGTGLPGAEDGDPVARALALQEQQHQQHLLQQQQMQYQQQQMQQQQQQQMLLQQQQQQQQAQHQQLLLAHQRQQQQEMLMRQHQHYQQQQRQQQNHQQ